MMMKKWRTSITKSESQLVFCGNVQYHDHEESKFSSTINGKSCAQALRHDKIIKSKLNKNKIATVKYE